MVNPMSLMRTPNLTNDQRRVPAHQLMCRAVNATKPFFVGAGLGVLVDTIQCDTNFIEPKHLASYAACGCAVALLASIHRKRAENRAMRVTLDTIMHETRTALTQILAYTLMLTTRRGFSNRLPADVLICLGGILKGAQMLRKECERLATVREFRVNPDNGIPGGIEVLAVPENEKGAKI